MDEERIHKSLFFICCSVESFQENFQKHPLCDVLIHSEVERKIRSKDIFKAKPSQETINFAISKRISQFLSSKKQHFLYYHLDSLGKDRIQRVVRMSERVDDAIVHLFVTEEKDFRMAKRHFSNVHLIDKVLNA